MNIRINGKEKEFPAPATLKSVIEAVCADGRHVIAELNTNIIHRDQWPDTEISDGDKIELVRFVGGG